ncbi:uncharacterized protein PHACADRAFT_247619 [Phanerochaete carnosa HHB-10118-sp]|uniref:Phosphatidylglycerol/phosphatidylinositol transfer protein n=1 Tax=Phanerochaete carnosa (strain HHB-10118-sp) TaxID=650164 RepID=K5XDR5_PHACS|nr:uncharacterized protein PHACADRAFT_247619 [Phanerochaete carnosa HHB-10118-sp]EKM61177.1 hypothetical protein PHACADRAFT_247619 [Phanerochaete carnosa HHB-10118-sp]
MARLSFLALLAAVSAGFAAAGPAQETLQTSLKSDKWRYEDCGDSSYPVHIKSIEISPDPPVPGQNLTVKVVGQTDTVVEDGAYADVTVKVGPIKLLDKEFDLCEEARKAESDISCPVEKGEHTVVQTVALPREIPHAPFIVNVRGYSVVDEPMVCLNIWIDFRTPKNKLW